MTLLNSIAALRTDKKNLHDRIMNKEMKSANDGKGYAGGLRGPLRQAAISVVDNVISRKSSEFTHPCQIR
jgi:hypothetical protein